MIRHISFFSIVSQSFSKKVFFLNKNFFLKDNFCINNVQRFHINCSMNAKGREIKTEKKKVVPIDEIELGELFDVQKLFDDMQHPVEIFKSELAERTSLRSSQAAIENIKIDFEGENYTIQDLATVQKKSSKLYVLDFSSFPQTMAIVMKTLLKSKLNLNPQQEGTRIFIPIPMISNEYRKTLAKEAKIILNDCKNNIRNTQNKYLKKLGNIEKLPEEKKFRVTNQITSLGEKKIKNAEEIFKVKENELLKIENT